MPNSHDLKNLTVLVTRPAPAGEVLCQELQAVGCKSVFFPVLAFGPPADIDLFTRRVSELDQVDWLIFISPQAVHASEATIHAHWPVLPKCLKIAAIGRGTAKALEAAGLRVDLFPSQAWNSEGLLALPEFETLAGKKIALVRGEGGQEILAQTLIARGGSVLPIIAYRRDLPAVASDEYARLMQENKLDVVVCASVDSLHNLKQLAREAWTTLQKLPLVVISERMRHAAKQAGFQKIFLASNASHDAIISILKRKFAANIKRNNYEKCGA